MQLDYTIHNLFHMGWDRYSRTSELYIVGFMTVHFFINMFGLLAMSSLARRRVKNLHESQISEALDQNLGSIGYEGGKDEGSGYSLLNTVEDC